MANTLGSFDDSLILARWFDATLDAGGWFSSEISSTTGRPEPTNVEPLTGSVVFAGKVASISSTKLVATFANHLVYNGKVPSIVQLAGVTYSPLAQHAYMQGKQAVISANKTVIPLKGAGLLVGHVSIISKVVLVTPVSGHYSLVGKGVTLTAAHSLAIAGGGKSTAAGKAVSVTKPSNVYVATARGTLTGYIPVVTVAAASIISPQAGHHLVNGKVASITKPLQCGGTESNIAYSGHLVSIDHGVSIHLDKAAYVLLGGQVSLNKYTVLDATSSSATIHSDIPAIVKSTVLSPVTSHSVYANLIPSVEQALITDDDRQYIIAKLLDDPLLSLGKDEFGRYVMLINIDALTQSIAASLADHMTKIDELHENRGLTVGTPVIITDTSVESANISQKILNIGSGVSLERTR